MAIFYRQTGAQQKLLCLGGPVVATDQRRAVNQRLDGSFELCYFVFQNHLTLHLRTLAETVLHSLFGGQKVLATRHFASYQCVTISHNSKAEPASMKSQPSNRSSRIGFSYR